MSSGFAENLAGLPIADYIDQLELRDEAGQLIGVIENKPGSAGSVRVYAYLAAKWGDSTPQAAEEGLAIHAEHIEDARLHPGKHPNFDCLLDCVTVVKCNTVRPVP